MVRNFAHPDRSSIIKLLHRYGDAIGGALSGFGTFRTSQDVRLELAKWGKADLDQVAVTNRNFMSTRPSTTLAD
jgi:hypothetical protein